MQQIQLIGNLGRDAVVNELQGGSYALNFNLAVNESYTSSEGTKVEKTVWYSISKFSDKRPDKLAQYLVKGSCVFIQGKPSPDLYTNKDNKTVPVINVVVSQLELISTPQEAKQA
jgi:single-strand DNA-binding protein